MVTFDDSQSENTYDIVLAEETNRRAKDIRERGQRSGQKVVDRKEGGLDQISCSYAVCYGVPVEVLTFGVG